MWPRGFCNCVFESRRDMDHICIFVCQLQAYSEGLSLTVTNLRSHVKKHGICVLLECVLAEKRRVILTLVL